MKPDKKMLESKTFYFGIITAVAAAFPEVSEWIADNPQVVMTGLGVLIVFFRRITSGGVKFLK